MTESIQETRLKTVIMFSIQFGNASGAEMSSSALNLSIPPLFPTHAHFSLHEVPINHFTIIPIYLKLSIFQQTMQKQPSLSLSCWLVSSHVRTCLECSDTRAESCSQYWKKDSRLKDEHKCVLYFQTRSSSYNCFSQKR